jgi:UDP-glucose 4-epimerase
LLLLIPIKLAVFFQFLVSGSEVVFNENVASWSRVKWIRTQMSKHLLIVGRNSFIAGEFIRKYRCGSLRCVTHEQLDEEGLFDGIDTIVTFARHPSFLTARYDKAIDIDATLADRLPETVQHYVMLSTRKVYSSQVAWHAHEAAPCDGIDAYGRNRIFSESYVRERIGPQRLTILRIGNVIGYELIAHRRMFMAMVLTRLKEHGEILYDMSPFVRRDFIPVETVADCISRVVRNPRPDIYNLSSGVPLMTGALAMWVLEGYGRGEFRTSNPRIFDEFCLDVTRFTSLYGSTIDQDELREYCIGLGRRLTGEEGNKNA